MELGKSVYRAVKAVAYQKIWDDVYEENKANVDFNVLDDKDINNICISVYSSVYCTPDNI